MQFDTPHLIRHGIAALAGMLLGQAHGSRARGLFSAIGVALPLRGRRLLAPARVAA